MLTTHLQIILHPTDYSKESQNALQYAVALARFHHSRLLVLHVAETLGPEQITYGEAVSQKQPDGYRRRLWEEFRRQVQMPSDLGEVELLLEEGDPVEAIVRTAAERHCDLIIMASHERSGLNHLLFRGTVEKVLGQAPCPVLVVKASATPDQSIPQTNTNVQSHSLSRPGLQQ
jgi:universal stress protein A